MRKRRTMSLDDVRGVADAVLVVEAGLASGSLHTARFAGEAGVPLLAVPGPSST